MGVLVNSEGAMLEFDDAMFVVSSVPVQAGSRRRRGPRQLDESPEPLEDASGADAEASGAQWFASRLAARGVVARSGEPFAIRRATGASAPGKRGAGLGGASRLTVPLELGEQAVVLIEGDGVLAWRFGRQADAPGVGASKRRLPGAERALVFDLDVPAIAAPTETSIKRGWIIDRLIEGARAIVLYFAAEQAAVGIVHLLERRRRTGPVVIRSASDLAGWESVADLSALSLPSDRPARLLLLVHGTFSSTVGAFGELAVTPWGQRLLGAALGRYDAVIGFDHRTLARSPLENAEELLGALRTLVTQQPIEFDAVCHSRGGLVLRSLVERLLPSSGMAAKARRAVFVAATNRGTELARPENWESMIDLVTNLAAVANKVLGWFPATAAAARIADEAIEWIGDFVRYLVEVAVAERKVPGLAAMDPGGPFVQEINLTQPGQPGASELDCFAIVSDFSARLLPDGEHQPKEMPKRLIMMLADGLVDRLMRGDSGEAKANDLVVDVASMTAIDAAVGGFVKDVLDFGRNPLVYHTNYFLRPEVAQRMALWLQLPTPVLDVEPVRLAAAQPGVARTTANATMREVRELLEREKPSYLVISRRDPVAAERRLLYYAVRPDEFTSFTRRAADEDLVINAFDLHETDQSGSYGVQQIPFDGNVLAQRTQAYAPSQPRPHVRRAVVLDRGSPVAVLEQDSNATDMPALAALAHELILQPATPAAPKLPAPRRRISPRPKPLDDVLALEVPSRTVQPVRRRAGAGLGASVGGRAAGEDKSRPKNGGDRGVRAKPPPRVVLPTSPQAIDLHASAEMPREVALSGEAIVTVTLSGETIEITTGPAAAKGRFTATLDEQITVHVIPRSGFDYVASDKSQGRAEVPPPKPRDPCVLDFVLVATEAGLGEVTVAIRQGAVRRLTLTLQPNVVVAGKPGRGTVSEGAGVQEAAACGACSSLEIFDRRSSSKVEFEFILRADGVHDRFRSVPIKTNLRQYVDARYKEIEQAWLGNASAVARFAVRLETIGGTMFRKLFPPTLQKVLWRLVDEGKLTSILVHSDEPFLPWEVVFIDDPDAQAATGQGRFFGELGLCRWLYGSEPVCSIEVRKGAARYVIPHYPQASWRLPDSEDQEEPMLQAELGARAVAPHHADLVDLLGQPGSFDLLHFAGHAQADVADGEADAASLWLEGEIVDQGGQRSWAKEALTAGTVEQRAQLRGADGRRPLVVVNACQAGRVGYSLTGLGGFATAFIGAREGTGDSRGRAGAFVGALWSVGDQPSSAFVSALYKALKQGDNMAQAARAARQATRDAGEGTWLAYTVYAHPNLKVRFR